MWVGYESWLVALSIVMAIQGAYVGFSLAMQIGDATGMRRRLLLAGAAASLAAAIWTMHFVGMLAAQLPFPVDYLVFPTVLSLLVCILVVGIAIYAISCGPFTAARLILSACLMGTGIFSMHYIGISALQSCAATHHAAPYVASSLVIAIAASGLALWLAAGRRPHPPLILSAVTFGIAVSGMHYTAMAGMTVFPLPVSPLSGPVLSIDLLAIVVAVVAFCVSGIFLLFLVPDRGRANTVLAPGAPAMALAADVPLAVAAPFARVLTDGADREAEFGRGTHAPLGGAGAPPARLARHLPVERDGATQFLAVDDVVAVHANAHYTYLFNGTAKFFCPLAIGDVESRLDKAKFLRVHRSHIINIDRVVGYRRNGDSETVEMAAPERYPVPVSRSRIGLVKSRIAAKAS